MSEIYKAESEITQSIADEEYRLHRLYESLRQAEPTEKPVIEGQIREAEAAIRRLQVERVHGHIHSPA